jgi:hypothetical protein
MEKTIDTHLFIDIILSEGCTLLYSHEIDDECFEYYHGINGRKICICTNDEFLTYHSAIEILYQLGLGSLIQRGLFK